MATSWKLPGGAHGSGIKAETERRVLEVSRIVEPDGIDCLERAAAHIRVQVGVGRDRVNGRWVRRHPATERGSEIPLAEVLDPQLDVLLLPREPVVLAETRP